MVTDRKLLELIVSNQVQMFKRLDIIESFVHGLAENAGTFPKDSTPMYAENIEETIEKMLRSAEATLTTLDKKIN